MISNPPELTIHMLKAIQDALAFTISAQRFVYPQDMYEEAMVWAQVTLHQQILRKTHE